MTVQGLCIPSNQKAHGQGRPPTRDACSPRATAAYSLDIPVFAVIGACKAAVAQCESSHELQLVLKSYSGSIREQGWTVLITECGKRGGMLGGPEFITVTSPRSTVWRWLLHAGVQLLPLRRAYQPPGGCQQLQQSCLPWSSIVSDTYPSDRGPHQCLLLKVIA